MSNSEEQRAAELAKQEAAQLAKQEAEQKAFNGWVRNQEVDGTFKYSLYNHEYKKEISKRRTLKDLTYDEMENKRTVRQVCAVILLIVAVFTIIYTYFILFHWGGTPKEIFILGAFLFPTLLPALRLFNLITKINMQLVTGIGTLLCLIIYIIFSIKQY